MHATHLRKNAKRSICRLDDDGDDHRSFKHVVAESQAVYRFGQVRTSVSVAMVAVAVRGCDMYVWEKKAGPCDCFAEGCK
jgi:hypothetical protein